MYDWLKSGDVVAFKGKWRIEHVGLIVPVFGEMVLYEAYEGADRPPCLRTGREKPAGVQAHRVGPLFDQCRPVIYPLYRPLFTQEEDRLLHLCEEFMAHNRDYCMMQVNEPVKGRYWASEFAATVLSNIGVARHTPCPGTISPARLVKRLVKQGFCKDGIAIN